jgi:hypothetical protein
MMPSEPTPAEVRLVERFRELERVTAAYRAHALLAGLQLLALGAWLAGSRGAGPAGARLMVLAAPLVWAVAAAVSLRLYPTVAPERWAGFTPAAFWIAAAAVLILLAGATWTRPAVPLGAALAAAAAGLGVVLVAVHVLARRAVESWRGLLAMLAAADAARDRFENGVPWAAIGVALLGVGAYRLVRFLWLGRRIRSLRRELGARG